MNSETHSRAKELLVIAEVEGIAADEREWLERHLETCLECSNEARLLTSTIHSFRALPVTASPDLVRRTDLAVRRRARELRDERAHAAPLWMAAAMCAASMILTTPYVWTACSWIGRAAQLPDPVWQLGFFMWWFMPATAFGAAAVWRQSLKQTTGSNGRSMNALGGRYVSNA